jgi:hypothetical protein
MEVSARNLVDVWLDEGSAIACENFYDTDPAVKMCEDDLDNHLFSGKTEVGFEDGKKGTARFQEHFNKHWMPMGKVYKRFIRTRGLIPFRFENTPKGPVPRHIPTGLFRIRMIIDRDHKRRYEVWIPGMNVPDRSIMVHVEEDPDITGRYNSVCMRLLPRYFKIEQSHANLMSADYYSSRPILITQRRKDASEDVTVRDFYSHGDQEANEDRTVMHRNSQSIMGLAQDDGMAMQLNAGIDPGGGGGGSAVLNSDTMDVDTNYRRNTHALDEGTEIARHTTPTSRADFNEMRVAYQEEVCGLLGVPMGLTIVTKAAQSSMPLLLRKFYATIEGWKEMVGNFYKCIYRTAYHPLDRVCLELANGSNPLKEGKNGGSAYDHAALGYDDYEKRQRKRHRPYNDERDRDNIDKQSKKQRREASDDDDSSSSGGSDDDSEDDLDIMKQLTAEKRAKEDSELAQEKDRAKEKRKSGGDERSEMFDQYAEEKRRREDEEIKGNVGGVKMHSYNNEGVDDDHEDDGDGDLDSDEEGTDSDSSDSSDSDSDSDSDDDDVVMPMADSGKSAFSDLVIRFPYKTLATVDELAGVFNAGVISQEDFGKSMLHLLGIPENLLTITKKITPGEMILTGNVPKPEGALGGASGSATNKKKKKAKPKSKSKSKAKSKAKSGSGAKKKAKAKNNTKSKTKAKAKKSSSRNVSGGGSSSKDKGTSKSKPASGSGDKKNGDKEKPKKSSSGDGGSSSKTKTKDKPDKGKEKKKKASKD